MPSVSDKQARFMQAVAHNPEFAKKAGVPQSVGKDFAEADKPKVAKSRPDLQGVNKPKTDHGSMSLFKKGGAMKESKAMVGKELSFMKKKGAPASMVKHEKAEMGMKKGGMPKFAKGGAIDGIAQKGKTRGKNC